MNIIYHNPNEHWISPLGDVQPEQAMMTGCFGGFIYIVFIFLFVCSIWYGYFLFSFLKEEAAEQQDVDGHHENGNDPQRQVGLGGSHGGKDQDGEAEDHGGEILVHQIIRHRGLEVAVDLTK